MTFEKVEIDTWKPQEANESVEGIFIKAEPEVGTNKSMLYSIEVNNKPTAVWGSAILDTKMSAVRPGDLIKIIYLGKGEAKGGHNAPKLFDVYVDYEHRDKLMAEAEANAPQAAPVAEVPVPVAPAAPVHVAPAPVAAPAAAPTTPATTPVA